MTNEASAAQIAEHVRSRFDTAPRSLAVFSAMWPLARAFGQAPDRLAEALADGLVGYFPTSTILMPTFTKGFDGDGLCDLDSLASITGMVSEVFRRRPDARRSRSAFFSFAIVGPERDSLIALAPREAWGEQSLYHWMLAADTQIVTIGLHPTHCSFSHLIEWLHRDRVTYRFNKTFEGRLRHEGREFDWQETLLVRQHNPTPINDFTWLLPHYIQAGMHVHTIKGVAVSLIGAAAKIEVMNRMMHKDPYAMLKNRSEFLGNTD
jgi:aminoglycoside N3'-acetyltransferase